MKKKTLAAASLLLALLMPLGATPLAVYADENTPAETTSTAWDVSCSKDATELDKNCTSEVTLALPSKKEVLASDVVFVMDKSECGKATSAAAKELVSQLLAQKELENARLKVGIVVLGGTAKVSRELSEVANADELNDAIAKAATVGLHGSNIQSGLIEADKMLSADTEVSDSRKYVVLISDGHTYQFSKENDYRDYVVGETTFNGLTTYGIYNETDLYAYAYGITYTIHDLHDEYYTDDYNNEDGTYKGDWKGHYLTDATYYKDASGNVHNEYELPYGTWSAYLEHITQVVNNDNGQYDVALAYDSGDYGNQCIGTGSTTSKDERAALADAALGAGKYIKSGLDADGNDNQLMHASGVDRSVYEAYNKYASMAKKYHCYPIYVSSSSWDAAQTTQDYGYQLMNALGEISNNTGTDVSVPNAAATTPDITNIFQSIKNDILYAVGADSTVEDVIGNDFTLDVGSLSIYVGDDKLTKDPIDENTWRFGDTTNSDRFTVAYNTDTKTLTWNIKEPITNFACVQLRYNVKLTNLPTQAGSHTSPTNERATLHPVDSNHVAGQDVAFPKPEVSYTVYTLNYDANGGSGAPAGEVNCTGKFTVSDTVPTRDGYVFAGWNTEADGSGANCAAGRGIEGNIDFPARTLYAQWNKLVTVSFDLCGHGGANISSQTFVSGNKASEPTAPKEDGWVFGGWYTEKGCKYRFSFDSAVTSDITLYAKWDRVTTVVSAPVATPTPSPAPAPAAAAAATKTATVKNAAIPQTSDVFPMEGLLALLAVGAVGFGAAGWLRKKHH